MIYRWFLPRLCANKSGVIDQDVPIFNGTLAENLLIAQTNRNPTELDGFLKKSGFNPFFQNFPNGYATLLGEEGINLSGGQKQLIGLCRALMRKPQILILDEPETALDGDVWGVPYSKDSRNKATCPCFYLHA
jgi:ABC-type multidrug transport system fused ATPase/permease subunit